MYDIELSAVSFQRSVQAPEAYPLGYVEDGGEPRTKLGAIFASAVEK